MCVRNSCGGWKRGKKKVFGEGKRSDVYVVDKVRGLQKIRKDTGPFLLPFLRCKGQG